jgi:seryl-tRNA synthetase
MSKKRPNVSVHVEEINKLKTDLEGIFKTLYKGNGTPALVTQVAKLEQQITNLDEKLESKFDHITEVVTEKFSHLAETIQSEFHESKNQKEKKWNFKTAVLTSVISSITAIIIVVLTHVLKNIGI